MLFLNIFGWSVSIVAFLLICVGAVILVLAVLSLLLWLCCYGCNQDEGEGEDATTIKQLAPAAAPASGPQGPGPPSSGPGHVAVPVADTSAPLGSNPTSGLPMGMYNPAVVRKWEEQLQATLFRKMSLEEVRVSTGNFNQRNYLGEGAFAVVFKGQGPNGVPWAVKRSKQYLAEGSSGAQDFEREVIAISRLSHKNLVRLLGYCIEEGEHILVYEYCPNGSLSSALYASRPELSFLQRLDIAIGTAEALYYLHSAASPSIIHRDVKPDNVFLDSQFQAKLGDFGLLKKLLEVNTGDEEDMPLRQTYPSMYTRIAGTPGYLDPEYHLTSKVTAKGDVYSFGVLLLQLCTGQRAILPQHPKFNEDSMLKKKSASGSVVSSAFDSGVSTGMEVATSAPLTPGPGALQPPESSGGKGPSSEPGSDQTSTSSAPQSGRIGTNTALAALGGAAGPSKPRDNPRVAEVMPGEPIHISTWLDPYVAAKVVEPVADGRFGNSYNKTALYRMLEIGLSCVRPSARKRPAMSIVTRSLYEVKEELERQVDEREGQYSSVFDRNALEGAWKGEEEGSSTAAESQELQAPPNQRSGMSSQQSAAAASAAPSSVASSVLSTSALESATMTAGKYPANIRQVPLL